MKRTTRDGKEIDIKDMTSDHIARCIRLIQLKGWRKEYEKPMLKELERRGDHKLYIFPKMQSRELEMTPYQQEWWEWFRSQD